MYSLGFKVSGFGDPFPHSLLTTSKIPLERAEDHGMVVLQARVVAGTSVPL